MTLVGPDARDFIHSLSKHFPPADMKLLRVAIVGAVALLGATCAASSCSDESSISGSTDSDYLVGRSSFLSLIHI